MDHLSNLIEDPLASIHIPQIEVFSFKIEAEITMFSYPSDFLTESNLTR